MSIEQVAYDALNLAKQNERDIDRHEKICAERYEGINETMREIKSLIKSAIGWGVSILLALLGFLLIQQFNDLKNQPAPPAAISAR